MTLHLPLAAGIADVADYLADVAPLIGALSSVALGITGTYLILHHTKKGANVAGLDGYSSPFEMPDGFAEPGYHDGSMSPFQLPEGYAGDEVDADGDSMAYGMRLITGPECLTTEEREAAALDDGSAHAGEIWDCEYCGADFPSEDFFSSGRQCPSCGHA